MLLTLLKSLTFTLSLPAYFDWRDTPFLSPLRNQHQLLTNDSSPTLCGSCWAMAATSTIADRYNIHKNKNSLSSFLSVQHVIDCNPYQDSCNGGDELHVYKYALKYGIPPETCNLYKGQATNCQTCYKCSYNGECTQVPPPKLIYITSYHKIPPNDLTQIKQEIYKRGPITCAIKATNKLEEYQKGIHKQFHPPPITLNHVVSVVGWGPDYLIIRNSWGIAWGIKGFALISTLPNYDLGITQACSYPLL